MTRPLPDWQPLPQAGETAALEAARMAAAAGSGLVALAATPDAHDAGWGPELAAEIGRRWAAAGITVRLLDLCLSDPKLHGRLGVPLGEGATDAILFGASLGRVLRPAGGLHFVSTGTPVTEAERTLRSDGMEHMARRLVEREGVSLLYVALGAEGAEAVLERADQVVLVTGATHDAEAALGSASTKTVAVVGPPDASVSPELVGAEAEGWDGSALPTAPPLADALRNAEPDPFDVPVGVARDPAPVARVPSHSLEPRVVEEVVPPPPPMVVPSRRGPLAVLALLLVLVLLAVAIQMGWIGAPDSFRTG